MNVEKTLAEIHDVKRDVMIWYRSAAGMTELAGETVDKQYPLDLWEMSDRELDAWMGDQLTILNDVIDPRPIASEITSHRRFLGPIIVKVKRLIMKALNLYTHSILERQRRFNGESVALQLAGFIRIRRIQARLDEITRQLAEQREMEALREVRDGKDGRNPS
ncbi:MAG: hypothetical protein RB296_12120 [Acidobacteriota bacterium]|jgi:hypothetical protein|nr:hypothetical protein [Acidobacteriota bacterium]